MLALSCAPKKNVTADIPAAIRDSLRVQAELGEIMVRTYEGTIPAADCPGILYRVTIYNQEHSGDGVFESSMTYLEADNGKDMTFTDTGRLYTLRGDAVDPNATVYQLVNYDSPSYPTNFLYQKDSITMLDAAMCVPDSGLNYTLKLVLPQK